MAWFKIAFDVSGADGYISQPMLVFGSAIGSGNYSRPSGEIVWCEADFYLNTFAGSGNVSSNANYNLEAESNGKIPKGAKAVDVNIVGSCGTVEKFFQVYNPSHSIGTRMYSNVANNRISTAGFVMCDSDTQIRIAPDSTAWNEIGITVKGVQLQ